MKEISMKMFTEKITVLLVLAALFFGANSCRKSGSSAPGRQSKEAEVKSSASRQSERKIKYYKSTMMPGEVSGKPAKDSMGMDMVPVFEDAKPGAANQPSEFVVPV